MSLIPTEVFLQQLPGMVYWKDSCGTFLGCSQDFAHFIGVGSSKNIIGKTNVEVFSDKFFLTKIDIINENEQKVLSQRQQLITQEEITSNEGLTFIFISTKRPLIDTHDNIIGLIVSLAEITSQEKAKQLSDVYLRNIVDSVPASIFWKDLEGRFLGCNQFVANMIGVKSTSEIIGKTDYDLPWSGKTADIVRKNDRDVISSGFITTVEESWFLTDGTLKFFLSTKAPLKDKNSKIFGIVGTSLDITELKKAEKELVETRQKLEGMTIVSASIAHEIRTPLSAVNFRTEYIQEHLVSLIQSYQKALACGVDIPKIDNQDLTELTNSLVVIQRETLAANTFVEMLLMNLKPKMGEQKIFSVTQCIDEALLRYPFEKAERARVIFNSENDFMVNGAPLLIVHILFNLMKNALYYTHQNGQIEIWLELSHNYNILYFKDTGQGVAKDILPFIFDQFFSKTYHGAGIGLTYCKMVMESLEGTITCESEEGSYTQFILSFPKVE